MSQSYGALRPQGRIAYLKGPLTSQNLIQHLSLELPNTPLETLKFLIQLGAVYVNKNRIQDSSFILNSMDQVRVHLEPKRYPFNKQELLARIIFENQDFVIFNKPTGIPMHATLDNALENLSACFDSKLFVTNRLDVPTSGLVLLAKNKSFQAYYNQLLSERKVIKTYQAVVLKPMTLGIKKHYMIISARSPKTVLDESEYKSQNQPCEECVLEIIDQKPVEFDLKKKIKTLAPGYLVTINLITGRTHQIRAQLSKLGAPIVGDEMYGGMEAGIFGLNCSGLQFDNFNWGLPFAIT